MAEAHRCQAAIWKVGGTLCLLTWKHAHSALLEERDTGKPAQQELRFENTYFMYIRKVLGGMTAKGCVIVTDCQQ